MPLNLGQTKRKQAISLTPLIDVVFILLLFFMLTSSFVPWRILDTPLAAPDTHLNRAEQEQDTLELTLKANDGRVWVNNEAIQLSNQSAVVALIDAHPHGTFIVKAEAGVTLQSLMMLADKLTLHGAETVSIANAFDMSEKP